MEELNKICRLCLDQDADEMHQIFDECLNNKIVITTGLDLLPTDAMPKKVCKNCRYQLEKSYFFRILAKQSDTRLRKFMRLKNQKKDGSYLLEKSYKDDDIEEYDEQMLESYKYFDDVKQQIEDEKQKIIQEEMEKLKAANKSPQRKQITTQTSPKKSISDKPVVILNKCPPQPPQTPQKLPQSRRKKRIKNENETSTLDISELQVVNENSEYEIQIVHTELVEGETDGIQFFEIPKDDGAQFQIISEEIVEEVVEARPKRQKKITKFLEKKSPKVQERKKVEEKKNLVEVEVEEQLQDVTNEYYFKVLEESDKLELDENGERKIFQCAYEDCKVTFSRRQLCKTHYFNHLAVDSPFECKYCSKRFKVQSGLERHERIHNNSKPFICGTCNKGFAQKEMLKRHVMIHLPIEEAKFECKICGKKFRQKDPLRQHILKAHSDKEAVPKFQCNLCEKSFSHSSGLSRHLLIHSGKIYTCETCKRPFNDKSALNRHEAIHTKMKN